MSYHGFGATSCAHDADCGTNEQCVDGECLVIGGGDVTDWVIQYAISKCQEAGGDWIAKTQTCSMERRKCEDADGVWNASTGGCLSADTRCPGGKWGPLPSNPAIKGCIMETCPAGTTGTYPNCVKSGGGYIAPSCPAGTTGTYPNCVKLSCPPGMTGVYPNCVQPPPPPSCPAGTTGVYPNCVVPAVAKTNYGWLAWVGLAGVAVAGVAIVVAKGKMGT